MPSLLQAGLDWSGRPSLSTRPPDFLIACCVALEDIEKLAAGFSVLRSSTFGGKQLELHGHRMSPERIAGVLQLGIDLNMRVFSLCIDLRATAANGSLPAANELHALSALPLVSKMLEENPVSYLSYDTDIEGKERQKRFETEVKRANTLHQPEQKIKVKQAQSHKNDLIQMADVVAYAMSRQFKSEKVEPEIAALLNTIRQMNEYVGREPIVWSEGEE